MMETKPEIEVYRIYDIESKLAVFASTSRQEITRQVDAISKQLAVAVECFGIYTNPYWHITHYVAEAPMA